MDWTLVTAAVGPLIGVGVGAWLTGHHQRLQSRQERLDEFKKEQRAACAHLLSAHRQFRRFVQISDTVSVVLVPVADRPDRPTAVAKGADRQWEIYESAVSEFSVTVDDEVLQKANTEMRTRLFEVIHARADFAAGAIPEAIVEPAWLAEKAFAAEARRVLNE